MDDDPNDIHEFLEGLRQERRDARRAASAFVQACRSGDVDEFYSCVDALSSGTVGGWPAACRGVARLTAVDDAIKTAFLRIWIESKMLPLKIGDDGATFAAARVLLPRYCGPDMKLCRGATFSERRHRRYGLSWSADEAKAEEFALERQQWNGGAVLLETTAHSEAIICAPHRCGGHYDESEYIVDRRLLGQVNVIRRFSQTER